MPVLTSSHVLFLFVSSLEAFLDFGGPVNEVWQGYLGSERSRASPNDVEYHRINYTP